jgi:hypothetical protein
MKRNIFHNEKRFIFIAYNINNNIHNNREKKERQRKKLKLNSYIKHVSARKKKIKIKLTYVDMSKIKEIS